MITVDRYELNNYTHITLKHNNCKVVTIKLSYENEETNENLVNVVTTLIATAYDLGKMDMRIETVIPKTN